VFVKKLVLQNFKRFEKAEINFTDFTLLIGMNDSGKTSGIK
jgi:predicted ATP-dependent endonuclease of OLD family